MTLKNWRRNYVHNARILTKIESHRTITTVNREANAIGREERNVPSFPPLWRELYRSLLGRKLWPSPKSRRSVR